MRCRRIVMTLSIAALFPLTLGHAQDEGDELRAIERERLRSLVGGDLQPRAGCMLTISSLSIPQESHRRRSNTLENLLPARSITFRGNQA